MTRKSSGRKKRKNAKDQTRRSNRNNAKNFNKHGLSRDIPSDVRRQIRQECGFGCVVCGMALYEYEHFDPPWRDAKVHSPDGIACLCGTCHLKKTKGVWSVTKIADARKNPKCLSGSHSWFDLDVSINTPWLVRIGNTTFANPMCIIEINGEQILAILPPEKRGAPPRISAKFYSRKGKIIASIHENEWRGDWAAFDIESTGSKLVVRSDTRKIVLVLNFKPPNGIVIEKLLMHYKGATISGSTETGFLFESKAGRRIRINSDEDSISRSPFWLKIDGDKIMLGQDIVPLLHSIIHNPTVVEADQDTTLELFDLPLSYPAKAIKVLKHGTTDRTAGVQISFKYPVNLSGKGPLYSPSLSVDMIKDNLGIELSPKVCDLLLKVSSLFSWPITTFNIGEYNECTILLPQPLAFAGRKMGKPAIYVDHMRQITEAVIARETLILKKNHESGFVIPARENENEFGKSLGQKFSSMALQRLVKDDLSKLGFDPNSPECCDFDNTLYRQIMSINVEEVKDSVLQLIVLAIVAGHAILDELDEDRLKKLKSKLESISGDIWQTGERIARSIRLIDKKENKNIETAVYIAGNLLESFRAKK